jgi:hypothetical protein
MRDGCIVNDDEKTSKACIVRCSDLLMSAPACHGMLNGGAIELLVSAIPALTFKPALLTLLLGAFRLIFAEPSLLPVKTRFNMKLRALQAGLPAHLAELLWMHMSEDVECIVVECASRLLGLSTGCRNAFVPQSLCISSSVDDEDNRADAAMPSTLVDAVVDAMKRSPYRRSTQHWGMYFIAHACAPYLDEADVDAIATRMVRSDVHALALAAILRHGLARSPNLKFDPQPESQYYLQPPPAPPPLALFTVGAQCLLHMILLGTGRYVRTQKLLEAGALKALELVATEPERDVYNWSRHGFRQSDKQRIAARERARMQSDGLLLVLFDLSNAFKDFMRHQLVNGDIANMIDPSFSSAVLKLVRGSAVLTTAERDVDDVLSKLDLTAYGSEDEDDSDPVM